MNFHVVFVVVASFFLFSPFIFSLSFFFLCGDFEHFLWVGIVSESTLIEPSFARQPHCVWMLIIFAFKASGHFAIGKRAGFFGAHSVQASEDGVDRAKACLVPMKKSELDRCLQT